jgi:tetratricopeptide (TPR) repeat protein
MKRHISTLLLGLFLTTAALAQSAQPGDAEMHQGDDFYDKKQYTQALQSYREAIAKGNHSTQLKLNAGSVAMLADDLPTAIKYLTELKDEQPTDWRSRSKLVKIYQKQGNVAAREATRKELYDLYKASTDPKFPSHYCREIFPAGQPLRWVTVYEAFKFEGDFKVKYTFVVRDEREAQEYESLIQLESSEADNNMALANHEIQPGQRLYSLDYNGSKEHRTYGFMVGEPDYDKLRGMVVDILMNKAKAQSSTKFNQ